MGSDGLDDGARADHARDHGLERRFVSGRRRRVTATGGYRHAYGERERKNCQSHVLGTGQIVPQSRASSVASAVRRCS